MVEQKVICSTNSALLTSGPIKWALLLFGSIPFALFIFGTTMVEQKVIRLELRETDVSLPVPFLGLDPSPPPLNRAESQQSQGGGAESDQTRVDRDEYRLELIETNVNRPWLLQANINRAKIIELKDNRPKN